MSKTKTFLKKYISVIGATTLIFTLSLSTFPAQKVSAATTVNLVYDFWAGADDSNPRTLTEFDGNLYFQANNPAYGYELWEFDPTDPGNPTVYDTYPGSKSSASNYFNTHNGKLYFTANDKTYGYELWEFDPATSTTSVITDINPSGNSSPISVGMKGSIVLNNKLYFGADDGSSRQLWEFDPATSTSTKITNMVSTGDNRSPIPILVENGKLFFYGEDTNLGVELYYYDGTSVTGPLTEAISPGKLSTIADNSFATATLPTITSFGNKVYFRGMVNGDSSKYEVFEFDTTTDTLSIVDVDIEYTDPYSLIELDGNLFFQGKTNIAGVELIKYDGTSSQIIDIKTGVESSAPAYITACNSKIYFRAKNSDYQLWEYDPATDASKAISSEPESLVVYGMSCQNNVLYMSADNSGLALRNNIELWTYDGTDLTFMEINPSGHSRPREFITFDSTVYFTADNGTNGTELMKITESKAPTNITLTSSKIDENMISESLVGLITTEDSDTSDHIYSLVDGIGADDNAFFQIIEDDLKTGQIFDFETKNVYSIRVKTTENIGSNPVVVVPVWSNATAIRI